MINISLCKRKNKETVARKNLGFVFKFRHESNHFFIRLLDPKREKKNKQTQDSYHENKLNKMKQSRPFFAYKKLIKITFYS